MAITTRKLLIAFSELLDEAIKRQADLEQNLKDLMNRKQTP
jgi:capsular polysaccharide biosynthesis protein